MNLPVQSMTLAPLGIGSAARVPTSVHAPIAHNHDRVLLIFAECPQSVTSTMCHRRARAAPTFGHSRDAQKNQSTKPQQKDTIQSHRQFSLMWIVAQRLGMSKETMHLKVTDDVRARLRMAISRAMMHTAAITARMFTRTIFDQEDSFLKIAIIQLATRVLRWRRVSSGSTCASASSTVSPYLARRSSIFPCSIK